MPAMRTRRAAGEICAMYMGPVTDEAPIARPPVIRKKMSAAQLQASAQPTADARYSAARVTKQGCLPKRSLGRPAPKAPTTVPQSALETVTPRSAGESEKVSVSE